MKMNAQPSVVARRTVLAAGAVGTVGLVAACGSDDSGDSASTSSGSTTPTAAAPSASSSADSGSTGSNALASTSEIPVGSGKIFEDEKVVITQPTEGDFKCFSAVCTHQGCLVSKVDSDAITCTCHQSTFSLKDGSVLGGPAKSALPAADITVSGTSISLA
ncbi:Rieske (2Fe-2S) protein [Phytohabitans aurantiacus]|jgi:nitrite reductase/ring-hydroxylating ferredoxin subunit|uniref:Rieske (2Fe-2S) protein n=1 Tax=Phytohabitans aurantiacus TaxID=3016789 RepID=UPI0024918802|nr:Rieske (2Fe-2S) protein [Phytohabitans aurantiacus]